MINRFIILICLLAFSTIYSQKVDNDNLIASIRADVTIFFLTKKILDKKVVKNDLDYVLITEISKNTKLGYNTNGIYAIAVFQSHSEKHILIKNNAQYKIYDIQKINLVLQEVIAFSVNNKLDSNEMLLYIKKIVQMYEDNYNSEYTAIKTNDEKP